MWIAFMQYFDFLYFTYLLTFRLVYE